MLQVFEGLVRYFYTYLYVLYWGDLIDNLKVIPYTLTWSLPFPTESSHVMNSKKLVKHYFPALSVAPVQLDVEKLYHSDYYNTVYNLGLFTVVSTIFWWESFSTSSFTTESAGRLCDRNVSHVFWIHNMWRFSKFLYKQQMWVDHTRTERTM